MSKEKKTNVILAGAALAVAIALFICWASTRPRALEGVKTLTVNINHGDGTAATFTVDTTARYLIEALDGREFVTLGDTDYGRRVIAADGESADPGEGVFWVFAVNGETPEERAEAHPIADGDVYDFYILTY